MGKNKCLMLDSRWSPVWEMAVHLAVAVDAFDGVLFVLCVRATEVLLYESL